MPMNKRYQPQETELRLGQAWTTSGIYNFDPAPQKPVFSIDTPPPTVSGYLHLGHVYSYTQVDLIARYRRMRGYCVFYPMGYDDNGLPTERLVEKRLGTTAKQIGRAEFIQKCLHISEEAEAEYQRLWQRLGLSIDWRFTYRTIDERSRRTNQLSFIELYKKGLAYRREAPAIWCPECRTALAQADLETLERPGEYIILRFNFAAKDYQRGENFLAIATTRPELLAACVAVMVHPEDLRYRELAGKHLIVPIFGQTVPILLDLDADPHKGTGAVMCCTFGDSTDIAWWYRYSLPTIETIGQDGRLTDQAGPLAGLTAEEARIDVKQILSHAGLILDRQPNIQTIRIHERCDTPVEYIVQNQWFIRLLEHKTLLIQAGEQINWYPDFMGTRYRLWVENLNWDWCISRQRAFGVPFPVWYCKACGEICLAEPDDLPIDPIETRPSKPCTCGSSEFIPETDVQDTWATSSLSPQIVGKWPPGKIPEYGQPAGSEDSLYSQVFPFSLRPQAHEIIRTWAFYTIVKSKYLFGQDPWQDVLISGWGLAGEGVGKISKSRGGDLISPLEMIQRYSADAVRYWAASTGPGKDSLISEEKIQMGAKVVTKLWSAARFCERFLQGYEPPEVNVNMLKALTPADYWILAEQQQLIRRVTGLFENYEFAAAKSEIEEFFWGAFTDNYIEMCKQRLYSAEDSRSEGARFTLYTTLLTLLKLFAPILPFITEEIYLSLFQSQVKSEGSIHASSWPVPDMRLESTHALDTGRQLVMIATAVRRFKSQQQIPLNSPLGRLQLAASDPQVRQNFRRAVPDVISITRAELVEIVKAIHPDLQQLPVEGDFSIGISFAPEKYTPKQQPEVEFPDRRS